MRTRFLLHLISLQCLSVILSASAAGRPNFIVILTDDMGYGDLGCYGADDIATPSIDRMAEEGIKLTSFYVEPVCSPTRAALMTGCYGQRVGIGGVMFPRNNTGLNPDEITLPELLKKQGYATAIVGKWHLGNEDLFQPMNHGFGSWYGTPASNSQFFHPALKKYAEDCVWREGYTRESILKMYEADCPLVRDNVVIEVPADQSLFTRRYTAETILLLTEFKESDTPFFIYLAHNMPHLPLHASEEFRGKSGRGLYGDVIEELDWSTGEILDALERLGLDENTLVVFTSDNGPNIKRKGRQGSALPLSGGKGDTLEGGVRVPCLARWPGKIPAGRVSDEPLTVMDLLPTLVRLAGGSPPEDRVIDGRDAWPVLSGAPDAASPHEAIHYLRGNHVDGIRVGDWKYHDAPRKDGKEKKNAGPDEPAPELTATLYHLGEDIGESDNLIEQHPEIAAELKKKKDAFAARLRKTRRAAAVAE